MAMIKTMGPGPHSDFSVDGTVISVGELIIDATDYQDDSERIVDVYRNTDGSLSLDGPGAFVLNIRIPARAYRTETVDELGTNEQGEPNSTQTLVPLDLDPDTVEITVWPRS
jgi:hypothetical protein